MALSQKMAPSLVFWTVILKKALNCYFPRGPCGHYPESTPQWGRRDLETERVTELGSRGGSTGSPFPREMGSFCKQDPNRKSGRPLFVYFGEPLGSPILLPLMLGPCYPTASRDSSLLGSPLVWMSIYEIFFSFETGYHSVARIGLEINMWPSLASFASVFLPQLPKCWSQRVNEPPCPSDIYSLADLLSLCVSPTP